ncbi:MAG: hypothetical protein E7372_00670 [Clostridiales bacterium]|nr:hypothetical protein [Clostridiales bacterium]
MRLFLGIILLLLCVFIGYCLSNKYYFRRVFYGDFLSFNTLFAQEIAFKQTTIINLIKNQKSNTDFYLLLNSNISGQDVKIDYKYLTNEEKQFVYEYLNKLGKFDKETQLDYIKGVNEIIKDKNESSILDEKRYKMLYLKVSFLIGLILLIIVL